MRKLQLLRSELSRFERREDADVADAVELRRSQDDEERAWRIVVGVDELTRDRASS